MCTIDIFIGVGVGVVGGEGEAGNSERCLMWGGGGVIKESFQKHLKIGDVGEWDTESVTIPAPILNFLTYTMHCARNLNILTKR